MVFFKDKRIVTIDEKQKALQLLCKAFFLSGSLMGFEPTTFGTTIRRSNQLSYKLHFGAAKIYASYLISKKTGKTLFCHFTVLGSLYYWCFF